MTTKIGSTTQWRQVTSANSIVVTDFYADWCGPCKIIAPTFDSLATKYAKPNRIAFAKVDVDNQREIAQQYGVRAMPTFVILRNGSVIDTIRGANPPALTSAVEKAVKLATGGGASFSTPGRTLASSGGGSSTATGIRVGGGSTTGGGPIQGRSGWFDLRKVYSFLTMFIGLYLTSLFSLDPYMSAKNSKYAAGQPTAPIRVSSGAPFGGRQFVPVGAGQFGPLGGPSGTGRVDSPSTSSSQPSSSSNNSGKSKSTFKTLADLGSE
ncbi:hypothetical protein SPBR_04362 [Sporothrix brasiliensis 5110]|uniref:Thioredoxin domain-containing protein n=1 Tax=Sporothrix brasiliensis 5110 TaxID=1398154 RepID=A0A0C2J3Z5_9PEZI|nr:uncharacterized protein SPBR_04362 [Sporothrix brasiliensis 5110]KIH93710.1 hypothetical protein SPBR_04362 [Sporothrix brasiliensis 5110]